MGVGIIGLTAMMWNLSAEREYRDRFPEEGRFFPSRLYVVDAWGDAVKKMLMFM